MRENLQDRLRRRTREWAGRTASDIAGSDGVCVTGIYHYARTHGIPLKHVPRGRQPDHPDTLARVERRRRRWEGRTVRQIADAEGFSRQAIHDYATTHGIPVKKSPPGSGRSADSLLVDERRREWPGRKVADIARDEGLSRNGALHYARYHRIPVANGSHDHSEEADRRTREWRGRTAVEVAESEGLSRASVYNYAEQHGIKLKKRKR